MNIDYDNLPKHIAIIMDGNRRWAKENGLNSGEGHKAGADNLEKIAKYCNKIGIKTLTVYAFSTENWNRSKEEVTLLMLLLKQYLDKFTKEASNDNIKVNVIGDITSLSKDLQKSTNKIMEKTKNNTGLVLNIAFNYGGRNEIINAFKDIATILLTGDIRPEDINEELIGEYLYTKGQQDPDLLIRTSGEIRISNFLPWQLVYTELYFTNVYWPDFKEENLLLAIEEYNKRHRRKGV